MEELTREGTMKLLSIGKNSRIYSSNDLDEAVAFILKYDGQMMANYEAALEGVYFVII